MKFPQLGPRNAYILFVGICLNAVLFAFVVFSARCGDVGHALSPSIAGLRAGDRAADDGGRWCRWSKLLDPDEVPRNRSIFFVETNRTATAHQLTLRQACSVESAAR